MRSIQPDPAAQALERAAIVDRFCRLDAQVKAFSPTKFEHERLRKLILSWYPELSGDQTAEISGVQYHLLIGMAQEQQYIPSMPALYRRMKVMRFLELCSMTIKNVFAELGEIEACKYLGRARTGPRTLTPVPKIEEAA